MGSIRIKRIGWLLTPPIIFDWAKNILRRKGKNFSEWEYLPKGWEAKNPETTGWNVDSVLQSQKGKWPAFSKALQDNGPLGFSPESVSLSRSDFAAHNTIMVFSYVLALAAHDKDRISLLDWGGGIGHYYLIGKTVLPAVEIDYFCKDVPILCQGGREILPSGSFYDDNACVNRTYDLVLASGSLQYSEDWKGAVEMLVHASNGYLYITRLPVVNDVPSFVVIQRPYQHGYETEYLGWFLNREQFLTHVASLQMELVREFLIQEKPNVKGAPEQAVYRGFLFRPIKKTRKRN